MMIMVMMMMMMMMIIIIIIIISIISIIYTTSDILTSSILYDMFYGRVAKCFIKINHVCTSYVSGFTFY